MKIEWDISELTEFANKLVDNRFEVEMNRATKEVAHALLKLIKKHTPIGDTWQLINGWNENDLAVTEVDGGYEVFLINRTMYATWVNDGHRQRPGRFIPGYFAHGRFYYNPESPGGMVLRKPFVKGRFFVEKGILELNNGNGIQTIVRNHLRKWWEGCF